MTSTAIALGCLVALGAMIWGAVLWFARKAEREVSARTLAATRAETIEALTTRKETDDAVNADPDLAGRAAKWVRPAPE